MIGAKKDDRYKETKHIDHRFEVVSIASSASVRTTLQSISDPRQDLARDNCRYDSADDFGGGRQNGRNDINNSSSRPAAAGQIYGGGVKSRRLIPSHTADPPPGSVAGGVHSELICPFSVRLLSTSPASVALCVHFGARGTLQHRRVRVKSAHLVSTAGLRPPWRAGRAATPAAITNVQPRDWFTPVESSWIRLPAPQRLRHGTG